MKKIFLKFTSYLSGVNISFLFFLFFIFSLPFQKKISFYSGFSLLEGRYIDYLTYSLYGFEILLALAFVLWFLEYLIAKKKMVFGDKKIFISILSLIVFSFLSSFFAVDRTISFYYIVILTELLVFYIFVINCFQKKENLFIFLNVFLFTMFLQSAIAVSQFALNHSIGLNLLGESPLSADLAGVAKTVIGGVNHIRAYGTFPHPNILAIFLVVSGIISIHLLKNSGDKKYRIYLTALSLFFTIALFLTFSRIAWILAIVFWGIYIFKSKILNFKFLILNLNKNKTRKKYFYLVLVFLIVIAGLVYFVPVIWWRINPLLPSTWDSLNVRWVVLEKSWVLIKNHVWGIGIGNFVIEIAYQLTGYPVWMAEPVHNTFILVLTEIGFLGLLSFTSILFFVFRSFKKLPDFIKYIFGILFVYMFFDHCFWDIRQIQFLLFLFIALASLSIYQKRSSGSLG